MSGCDFIFIDEALIVSFEVVVRVVGASAGIEFDFDVDSTFEACARYVFDEFVLFGDVGLGAVRSRNDGHLKIVKKKRGISYFYHKTLSNDIILQ